MEVPFRCLLYIEVQGRNEWEVEERGLTTMDRLKTDGRIDVIDAGRAGIVKVGPYEFVDTLELEVVGDLRSLLSIVLDYTPSAVEVISPPNFSIDREELSNLMLDLAGGIRRIASSELELGDLGELPLPPLGYEESELAELVYEGRHVFYETSFETFKGKETTIKTLTVLGCGIDKISFKETKEGRNVVNTTLVSPFDSLLAVTAFYAPRRVKVLDPSVVDVTALELQNGLMDVAGIVRISLLEESSCGSKA